MSDNLTTFQHIQKHYKRFAVVFVVLLLVCGAGYVVFLLPEIAPVTELPQEVGSPQSDVLTKSEPALLRIPKIDLTTTFEAPLGVDDEGALEVPKGYDKVGWYKYGPTPGERGPAVILGHIDSYKGPAVFYNLRKLDVGDEVYVDREDGTTATFVIEKSVTYPQSSFPTEDVYGNIPYAGLRLITCAGIYDKGTKRFSHNLVVYAKLKK